MRHHAYVIEGRASESIERIMHFLEHTYSMSTKANPDILIHEYGFFSVEDARTIRAKVMTTPIAGDTKAVILIIGRIYNDAQNVLLKLLEEPAKDTVIIIYVPFEAMLLPTVRSRVLPLPKCTEYIGKQYTVDISEDVKKFIDASSDKRSLIIKKFTLGKDVSDRRELRDKAIHLLNGIEIVIYDKYHKEKNKTISKKLRSILADIEELRGYLYDKASPIRMILEHLSLMLGGV